MAGAGFGAAVYLPSFHTSRIPVKLGAQGLGFGVRGDYVRFRLAVI